MTRTAVIYHWNSLIRQYKSECEDSNPLFTTDLTKKEQPRRTAKGPSAIVFSALSHLFDLKNRGGRLNRIRISWRRINLDEPSCTRHQKIQQRHASLRIDTSTTRHQQQQGQKWSTFQKFTSGTHLADSIGRRKMLAIPYLLKRATGR